MFGLVPYVVVAGIGSFVLWRWQKSSPVGTKIIVFLPVLLTLLMVAWTALVYSHSSYGSWHIYPALAIAPVILICHVALIAKNSPRSPFILYCIAHVLLVLPLWVGCLMLISKDSL
jgi:hypothetical protein